VERGEHEGVERGCRRLRRAHARGVRLPQAEAHAMVGQDVCATNRARW
jgi:hypothetical protein